MPPWRHSGGGRACPCGARGAGGGRGAGGTVRMTVIRAAGDAALLIEAEDLSVVHGLTSAIATERIRGVADIIPGAGTVLVVTEPGSWELGALAARLRGVLGGAKRRTPRQIPRGVLGGRTPRQAPR